MQNAECKIEEGEFDRRVGDGEGFPEVSLRALGIPSLLPPLFFEVSRHTGAH